MLWFLKVWRFFCHHEEAALLNWTKSDRRTCPEPKTSIKRFREFCLEGVEMDRCCWRSSVEGQRATWMVHIHSYFVVGSRSWAGGDELPFVIVADRITVAVGAAQTPGHVVESKLTVIAVSFTPSSFIAHRDLSLPTPDNLPVRAIRKAFLAQNLGPVIKSFFMVRVILSIIHTSHFPVVFWQLEFSVYCVCVDCELTGIWYREQTIQLQLLLIYWHLDDSWITDGTVSKWLNVSCFVVINQ